MPGNSLHTMGQQHGRRSWAEPWKIKMVEPLKMTTREERVAALDEAGYNTFLLRSDDVYIDLLTDSGTSAMSDRQWAGMMLGDEAYAGSRNFYHLEAAVQRFYGYRHILPTHQGRGAEHLVSQTLIKPGDHIPGNMYFTTTRLHQELAGATFHDVIVDEAHDPQALLPFKGNVDLAKVQALIDEVGAEKIPYVSLAGTVNMAGGQPVSMANVRDLRALCDRHGIRLLLDATRMVENSLFIQEREEGYADKTDRRDPARVLLVHGRRLDVAPRRTTSSTSAAGWPSTTTTVFEELRNLVVVYEGLHTYGGLAGRDMEALAIGIEESVSDEHIRSRVGQVRYLGELLAGVGHPDRGAGRRPRDLPRRAALLPAPAAGPVPGPDAGRGAVPRLRDPVDGARDRVRRPQRGDGRPQPAEAGADPAHDPAARVHAGAHGRRGRVREGLLRRPGQGTRAAHGLRAEVPAVLPGAVRADLSPADPGPGAARSGSTVTGAC